MAKSLTPSEQTVQVISVGPLLEKASYLNDLEKTRLVESFRFSDAAHLGQSRQSGDPYISHPLAVA